jgi:L-methionine (R)-S-oxide reductase
MPDTHVPFEPLLDQVKGIVAGEAEPSEKLRRTCALLHHAVPHYDWVGFYVADPEARVLTLGPFSGAPTEHVRIPFGRGICGQAAAGGRAVVVADVSRESNYLACSTRVKSEIVVPVFRDGRAIAQIDVDSHTRDAFGAEDRSFLTRVCEAVSGLFSPETARDDG